MRTIPLTQGKCALVDDADYDRVNQFKWCAAKHKNTFYAVTGIRRLDGVKALLYMHNFLLGGPTDHVAPNSGLDNRQINIRLATNQQNQRAFQAKRLNCTSNYRGVTWNKSKSKWAAQIFNSGKKKHLGYFVSEVEAANAYNVAALIRDPIFHQLNVTKRA